jgi:alpha-tubulin suppressor-like RCC1 family protein
LGNGSFNSNDGPVAVSGAPAFTQLTAGAFHTCGLTSTGAAFCWGDTSFGELGDNGESGFASTEPVAVSGGLRFKSISAGAGQTCGITTAGAAYCWGDNSSWQLGTNAVDFSEIPTPVSGGRTDYVAVTVGWRHACATIAAGGVYCWGSNVYGALGNELQAMRQAPPTRVFFPVP